MCDKRRLLERASVYIYRSSLCLCLHCLTGYVDGCRECGASLTVAIHRLGGVSPFIIAHEPAGRRWTPVAAPSEARQ